MNASLTDRPWLKSYPPGVPADIDASQYPSLVALMEEGVAAGEFIVQDVHLTALAIVGIVGWSQVWYRPGGRLTRTEAAQRVSTLVLAMVQAKHLTQPLTAA